jgi:hypothetical protein
MRAGGTSRPGLMTRVPKGPMQAAEEAIASVAAEASRAHAAGGVANDRTAQPAEVQQRAEAAEPAAIARSSCAAAVPYAASRVRTVVGGIPTLRRRRA